MNRVKLALAFVFFGAATALALVACMKPGDGMGLDGEGQPLPKPPVISYASPVVDTTGKPASHVPTVNGAAESFTVAPALPAGLSLNGTSGAISGTPTAPTPAANYSVTARGKGGVGVAVINITVLDLCVIDPDAPGCRTDLKPEISYASPVTDTVGKAATHSPQSTGGVVSSFALEGEALPAGLALDPVSGAITGTPTAVDTADCNIVATGPGGKDTAAIRIVVVPGLPALYFEQRIRPWLNDKCSICHSPTGTAWGQTELSLRTADSYNALVNQPTKTLKDELGIDMMRVKPGKPESSYVYLKLTQDQPLFGGRMPLNEPPLSQQQIDLMRTWIAAGAPPK